MKVDQYNKNKIRKESLKEMQRGRDLQWLNQEEAFERNQNTFFPLYIATPLPEESKKAHFQNQRKMQKILQKLQPHKNFNKIQTLKDLNHQENEKK